MKKTIIALMAAVFLVSTAQSLTVDLQTVQSTANTSDPARFNLEIENNNTEPQQYSVSLLSPKSSWFYYTKNIQIPSKSKKKSEIIVSPVKKAVQQKYRFNGKVREKKTGKTREFTGFFNVEQPYILHITNLDQNKEQVKPGKQFNTSIEIQNLDNTPVENYNVQAKYENQEKNRKGTQILSQGTRRFQYTFTTNKNASPSTQKIQYTVTANNKTQTTANQEITIQEIKNISKKQNTENRILTVTKKLKAQNQGNTPTNATLKTSIPNYLESITNTNPEPSNTQKNNSTTTYTWTKTLKPGEKLTVQTQTGYWIPILGITLLTLGIIAIKKLGQDIKIKKTTEKKEDQNIKIQLEIRNTGNQTYDELLMEEFIPDIATVNENFDMNTPKIQKTTEGTKLTWKVENLEPGDQRIIQYHIKPKIEVEDQVTLQKAQLIDKNGEKKAESNKTNTQFQPNTN